MSGMSRWLVPGWRETGVSAKPSDQTVQYVRPNGSLNWTTADRFEHNLASKELLRSAFRDGRRGILGQVPDLGVAVSVRNGVAAARYLDQIGDRL